MAKTSNRFLLITFLTKKPIIIALVPLLLLSFLVGWFYQTANFEMNLFIQGEINQPVQFMEGIILVSIAILSGILIVVAIRRNLEKVLKVFFSISLFISSISVFWLHGYLIKSKYSEVLIDSNPLTTLIRWIDVIMAIFGLIVGISTFFVLILEKGDSNYKNALIFTMGIAIGTIFGLIFHIVTFFTLLILISIFDIYSVFRGPISKIFEKTHLAVLPQNRQNERTMVAIGIGDFIFYSALVTFISSKYSLVFGLCSMVGIIVGIKITEKMLYRYTKFPGLPFPIFLSLFLFGMGWLVDHYLLSALN
ncbi:MAG: hypothetical protein KAS63_00570 [Candidatus Heimdallarchaeota archaeon]|nr:hypothetical protein [Candidatus Heimdallarchaeota archaeon]MCK4953836.1 hypothetical protein [Candidatus Heimdallarchaeota archaeon]